MTPRISGLSEKLSAARIRAALLGLVIGLPVSNCALAFDNGIQFGPSGPGASSTDTYSREFIKQYEGDPQEGTATLLKANVKATKAAVERYEKIVKQGGWPTVPKAELRYPETNFAVSILRYRLAISGEYQGHSSGQTFDGGVEKAVKRFQRNNGLTPTGIVDKRTLAALNVSAETRLKQLKVNVRRLARESSRTDKKYLVVNIPAAHIEAVENGKVVERYAGVVGKPDRATPLLRSRVHEMNFNPVWRLPPTVIREDLIPRGRQMQAAGKNVLIKFGIDAYSGGKKVSPEKINWASSQPSGLRYSQKPGKDNPLGFLKINFHNGHSVYLHDTPKSSVFGRNFRASSSGCVRVSNIEKLALWILKPQGWKKHHVEKLKESGERKDVKVKHKVPLYFVYITAWATPDGDVQFRRDLYNKDGVGTVAGGY